MQTLALTRSLKGVYTSTEVHCKRLPGRLLTHIAPRLTNFDYKVLLKADAEKLKIIHKEIRIPSVSVSGLYHLISTFLLLSYWIANLSLVHLRLFRIGVSQAGQNPATGSAK